MTDNATEKSTPENSARLFENLHRLWVAPELERRRNEHRLPTTFQITHCLILLPPESCPVVLFNDEIHWEADVRKPVGRAFEAGDPVFIWDIERIETVHPPTVEGRRVPFFYICATTLHWRIFFDGAPDTHPSDGSSKRPRWWLGEAIATALNERFSDRVTHILSTQHSACLQAFGLWVAPALVPYPLAAIASHVAEGRDECAVTLLREHCTADFLADLVRRWNEVDAFAVRHRLFHEALEAHSKAQYTLSIHALLPHIEGIARDVVETPNLRANAKRGVSGRVLGMLEALGGRDDVPYAVETVRHSLACFVEYGPVMETFNDWQKPLSAAFPNRHAIGHGRYVESLYTESNSIKVFLLLDTLFHVLRRK
jgi:hypothetical protein